MKAEHPVTAHATTSSGGMHKHWGCQLRNLIPIKQSNTKYYLLPHQWLTGCKCTDMELLEEMGKGGAVSPRLPVLVGNMTAALIGNFNLGWCVKQTVYAKGKGTAPCLAAKIKF